MKWYILFEKYINFFSSDSRESKFKQRKNHMSYFQ